MSSPIKIYIETPCGEDFRQFTPTEQGGFCQSCQKEVIDFTSMSDRAVYNYFQQAEGNVCGRLRKDQLKVYHAMLPVSPVDPPKTKWYLALAASLGLLALVQPNEVKSQVLPLTPKPPVVQVDIPILEPIERNGVTTISGRLTDTDGEALIGANIIVMEFNIGTSTDLDGNYSLEVPAHAWGSTVTLVTAYVGYRSVERVIRLNGKSMEERFVLKFDVLNLDEVVVGGVGSFVSPKLKLPYTKAILTTDSDGNLY